MATGRNPYRNSTAEFAPYENGGITGRVAPVLDPVAAQQAAPTGADPFAYTQGSLLTPWTEVFSYGGPTGGATAAYNPFEYEKFKYDPFSYADFKVPGAEGMYADPGYQFRLDQGRKQLEASAAGRGLLRTGGTLKGLMDYGQNAASQEYGNVFNRALQTYGTNRSNAADIYGTNYNLYKDTYGQNYNLARQRWQDDASAAQQAAAASNAAASSAEARALREYNERKNNFLGNQDTQFNRLVMMAKLGDPSGYAGNMTDLVTGQGNANAAGRMGQANAWTNALSNLGNTATDYGMYYGDPYYRMVR